MLSRELSALLFRFQQEIAPRGTRNVMSMTEILMAAPFDGYIIGAHWVSERLCSNSELGETADQRLGKGHFHFLWPCLCINIACEGPRRALDASLLGRHRQLQRKQQKFVFSAGASERSSSAIAVIHAALYAQTSINIARIKDHPTEVMYVQWPLRLTSENAFHIHQKRIVYFMCVWCKWRICSGHSRSHQRRLRSLVGAEIAIRMCIGKIMK